MSNKATFPPYDSYKYCQVFVITERRDGAVYGTKLVGYAKKTEVPESNDITTAPLSTKVTNTLSDITLELLTFHEIIEKGKLCAECFRYLGEDHDSDSFGDRCEECIGNQDDHEDYPPEMWEE